MYEVTEKLAKKVGELSLKTKVGKHTLRWYSTKYGSLDKFVCISFNNEDGYYEAVCLGDEELDIQEDEVYVTVYLVKPRQDKKPIVHLAPFTIGLISGLCCFN